MLVPKCSAVAPTPPPKPPLAQLPKPNRLGDALLTAQDRVSEMASRPTVERPAGPPAQVGSDQSTSSGQAQHSVCVCVCVCYCPVTLRESWDVSHVQRQATCSAPEVLPQQAAPTGADVMRILSALKDVKKAKSKKSKSRHKHKSSDRHERRSTAQTRSAHPGGSQTAFLMRLLSCPPVDMSLLDIMRPRRSYMQQTDCPSTAAETTSRS